MKIRRQRCCGKSCRNDLHAETGYMTKSLTSPSTVRHIAAREGSRSAREEHGNDRTIQLERIQPNLRCIPVNTPRDSHGMGSRDLLDSYPQVRQSGLDLTHLRQRLDGSCRHPVRHFSSGHHLGSIHAVLGREVVRGNTAQLPEVSRFAARRYTCDACSLVLHDLRNLKKMELPNQAFQVIGDQASPQPERRRSPKR